MLSSLLEPCLCASLALAPVPCSSPATPACWNQPASFVTILPKPRQADFPSQAQSPREFPTPLFPEAGMTHGILSLPVTQLMKSQEQLCADVGAPAPASAPCQILCGSAAAPSPAPSQSWTLPCHSKLMKTTDVVLVPLTSVIGWFWPRLLRVLLMVSRGPGQALHCRRWGISFSFCRPQRGQSAEAALTTLKQRQRGCVGMFGSTATLSAVPGRNPAIQHPHFQGGLTGKVLVPL